jgi:hypothetical protein
MKLDFSQTGQRRQQKQSVERLLGADGLLQIWQMQ